MQTNKRAQLQDVVRLSKTQQQMVRKAIVEEAALQGQRIYALAVHPTHVHVVAQYTPQPISKIVAYYKKAARLALKALDHNGRLWTEGYDKRFCFDRTTLEQRIKYVQGHKNNI